MWDKGKNPDWAPKIFKTQRIQTQKINTNLENQTQEHKKIKPRTHEHKPRKSNTTPTQIWTKYTQNH